MEQRMPQSSEDLRSWALVALVAGLAAFARMLYGKKELSARYLVGGILVAMVTAWFVYGLLTHWFGELGGQFAASCGAAAGLFTDDLLKRAGEWVRTTTKIERP